MISYQDFAYSPFYTHYDKLEGETIQRIVSPQYHNTIKQTRTEPVDLSVCEQLIDELEQYLIPASDSWESIFLRYAQEHLRNAMNESLPQDVRETHFDIAGAKVWNVFTHGHNPFRLYDSTQVFSPWMATWKRAGGV